MALEEELKRSDVVGEEGEIPDGRFQAGAVVEPVDHEPADGAYREPGRDRLHRADGVRRPEGRPAGIGASG